MSVLLCLMVAPHASAVTATTAFGYLATFAPSSPSGQVNTEDTGVAVGQSTGNVFVAEESSGFVGIYAPEPALGGAPLTRLDAYSATAPASVNPQNLAVDPVDDTLYVAGTAGAQRVVKFVSDGAPVPTYTEDPAFAPTALSTSPAGIAVDPASHDLLVADRGANRVFRLSAANGSTVSSFDGSDTAGGAFVSPGAVAVSPAGVIVVIDGSTRIERLSAAGTALGALPTPAGGEPVAVTFDPQSGDLVAAIRLNGQTYLQGFTAAGTSKFLVRFQTGISTSAQGLALDGGSGRLYANLGDGSVNTFIAAVQPGLDAPVVNQVRRNVVQVSAEVAPGGETTSARFEYCPASAACAGYAISDPSDSFNPWVRGPVHDDLTSTVTIQDDLPLRSNASWRVRVWAGNASVDNTSAAVTVDSPLSAPGVETGAAGSVSDTSAELTGTIDTIGSQTTYHFEYGLTTGYGKRIPAEADDVAGDSRTPRAVSRPVTGLQPGTTYHYRLVARNSAGEDAGPDRTLTTLGTVPVSQRRGYEQVTPTDKRGGAVNGLLGFQAAADGNAVAYQVSAAPSDAPSAVLFTRYLSRRTDRDWLRWQPLDPPLNVSRGIVESVTHAISPNFGHAMVVSNRALAPGGLEGGGNLYVTDLATGAYTLIGAAPGLSSYLKMAQQQTENIYLAGAPDFSWIVFIAPVRLRPDAPEKALYKWTRSGGLQLESLLPDGTIPTGNVQPPDSLSNRMVSDDGNTMYFSLNSGEGGVYRRTNGQTTAISVSHLPGAPSTVVGGKLDAISRDGRYAFFRTPGNAPPDNTGPLTVDGPGGFVTAFMYRYDAHDDSLTFVGAPVSVEDQQVPAVGDDGRTVYFRTFDGTTAWRDGLLNSFTTSAPSAGTAFGAQAFSSPDGRYFGYSDNSNGTAHLYDAETRQDVCVSCAPDGSGGRDGGLPGGVRTISNRAPQVVINDGTMFYDTATPLVSADHNAVRDVYAYKNGTVTLISSGDDNFPAWFGDASPDGRDVYFTTRQSLVGQDTDQAIDIYDARVGGGLSGQSPPLPRTPCTKSGCGEANPGPVVSPLVAEPVPAGGVAGKRTNQARIRLSLTRIVFGARSGRIGFRASGPGRVKVTGTHVRTTVRNVAKAGNYSITVPLSSKARSMLRAHRRFKVTFKVTLAGGWGSASSKYSRTLGK